MRTWSERHIYGALFSGAALSFCLGHVTGRVPLPSDLLAIAGYATCGWSWLVTRVLFKKPEAPRRLWPPLLVLEMTLAGAVLRYDDDRAETVPRMIGNMETLVSSTLMLFAMIQPLSGDHRDMPAAERRFRRIYVAGYLADLTIGMIAVKGAPAGRFAARWAAPIQISCALAAVVGMTAALMYRDRHPIPMPAWPIVWESRSTRSPGASPEHCGSATSTRWSIGSASKRRNGGWPTRHAIICRF